jgi:UDP-N-acetylglucosamine 2-epimerase (non-hydrolysing)
MNKKKYYFFIGTEAELIKMLPVLLEFEKRKTAYTIIASGQNNILHSELLKLLKHNDSLLVLHKGAIKQTASGVLLWFLKTFLSAVMQLRSEFSTVSKKDTVLIIHGDTVSTVMGAFIAKIYGLKIAHIEAGLRSFNYLHPFPEEIDRVLTSKLATIHFCPNQWAVDNLKNNHGIKINTYQNTLLDSLNVVIDIQDEPSIFKKIDKQKYFIFIMHRQENLFNDTLFENLVGEVIGNAKKMKCVFVMHKPTQLVLEQKGLLKKLMENNNIILSERLSYIQFMKLLNRCEYIITDGGSNQEESYYFGKPCLILRTATERIEGLGENVVLSKNNIQVIREFFKNPYQYKQKRISLQERPSEIIADYLINN